MTSVWVETPHLLDRWQLDKGKNEITVLSTSQIADMDVSLNATFLYVAKNLKTSTYKE